MSKEIQFIQAIEKVLSEFESKENKITTKNAKDILHIRGLLDNSESLIELHALIADYVDNEMSRKLFGFLPFVIDLKSLLIDILNKEDFSPIHWLKEERRSRRSKSCDSFASVSSGATGLTKLSADDNQYLSYESRFSTLEKEIKEIKENNVFYKTKNDQLEKAVTEVSQNHSKIKEELGAVMNLLKAAQSEIDKLNLIILQKDEVIFKLSSENEKLKDYIKLNNQQDKSSANKKRF